MIYNLTIDEDDAEALTEQWLFETLNTIRNSSFDHPDDEDIHNEVAKAIVTLLKYIGIEDVE